MARRTWRELGSDIDSVVIEVWTGEQITWKRTRIFFKELWKAIKGGRQSWAELEHQELLKRFAAMRETDGEQK